MARYFVLDVRQRVRWSLFTPLVALLCLGVNLAVTKEEGACFVRRDSGNLQSAHTKVSLTTRLSNDKSLSSKLVAGGHQKGKAM